MRIASLFLSLVLTTTALAQQSPAWHFAVSGDSRNCGDVVMPAIAGAVRSANARFYWHLGDFRAIYDYDQDFLAAAGPERPRIIDYETQAWDDFIANQLDPFAATPVYLAIGNHETIPPKTRPDFVIQFADWLDTPVVQAQRLKDNPHDHRPKPYYHWLIDSVDFITLDNASPDQFNDDQIQWIEQLLQRDEADPSVRAIVVGMHASLPQNISGNHSMGDWPQGDVSGRRAYADLLHARDTAGKQVYILSSHSHFFLDGAYNTQYWRDHGGVLPGWIIGTGGAIRYRLPDNVSDAKDARTGVYGFLLATVDPAAPPDHYIQFQFQEVKEEDVPAPVKEKYSPQLVHDCFTGNSAP